MSRRTERISEQLREEIARVLRRDVTDPRVRLVTVTRVDVAPDLSHAVVFWSTLEEREQAPEEVAHGLESAAAFVRRRLARVLPLKKTPELRFRYDPSMVLAQQTLSVLSELRNEEKT